MSRRRHRSVCLVAATLGVGLSPTVGRAIEFNLYYTDPDGQGFFDPVLGAQRRAAINFAASLVGRTIRPTYLGETYDIRVTSTASGGSLLAAARPAFFVNNFSSSDPRYQPNTQFAKALGSHLAHTFFNPADDDITMTVNLAQPFYWGTDGVVPANQYDFVTTAAHEILHGLGFYGSFRAEGGFGVDDDGEFTSQTDLSGYPTVYDTHVTVGPNGVPLATLTSSARAANLTSNNLFWSGANGTAGNGGTPAKLNAPSTFSSGSSVGHLDATTYPNDIMGPSLSLQQVRQTLSPVTRGILRDIGWDIGVVSAEVGWLPVSAADNRASTFANWTQSPYPGDSLAFGSNPAGVTDVKMDVQLYSHPQIRFSATAPAAHIPTRT